MSCCIYELGAHGIKLGQLWSTEKFQDVITAQDEYMN